MTTPYTYVADINAVLEPPTQGTLSRTVHNDERLKAVMFGFDAGQELSAHTAPMPAILHFLSGEATVGLGDDTVQASAGTWIQMPPNLPHSIHATTPVTMLLLMLKQPAPPVNSIVPLTMAPPCCQSALVASSCLVGKLLAQFPR